MASRFDTTNWSLVLAARAEDPERARQALAVLCEAYWYPVYAFVRRQGHGADEARDLTQSYFLKMFEKDYLRQVRPGAGRFRFFLLASVKHFLANERDRVQAKKRAPEQALLSLDVEAAARRYEPVLADRLDPEQLFEREWALAIVARALARLGDEMRRSGGDAKFEHLRPYLTGEEPASPYREAAAILGTSEPAIKVAVHRMRRRFGELLRDEVAQTVEGQRDVQEELRHLIAALGEGGLDV